MNYQEKYFKYKLKYQNLKKGGVNDDVIINLIKKWWEAVRLKNVSLLKELMSPAIQIININSRYNYQNFLDMIKKYHISDNYKLYDFNITRDGEITIVSYLVNNEIETTTKNKVVNRALHSVVLNNNKIISWNNFSHE